ncbi:hypothetical protein BGZ94_002499 [Podila epigama]|nr:hypothetical protein BGZ94_002499 [Podila epigama]
MGHNRVRHRRVANHSEVVNHRKNKKSSHGKMRKHRNSFIIYRCLLSAIKDTSARQIAGMEASSSTKVQKKACDHQKQVSVIAANIWNQACSPQATSKCDLCANCKMQNLFKEASKKLKHRLNEKEQQLMNMSAWPEEKFLVNEDEISRAFDWETFERLYDTSSLFKDHENIRYNDGSMPTVAEIKVIWIEYEKKYEMGWFKRLETRD